MFKVLALCLIALVALLFLLPPPPDNDLGGSTTISKRVPVLRDTVDPLAKAEEPSRQIPGMVTFPSVSPQLPTVSPQVQPAATPTPVPKIVTPPPPAPVRKPQIAQAQPPAPPPVIPQIRTTPPPPSPDPAPAIGANAVSRAEIGSWMKSQAWEFLGGVDEEGNILYRFEVWLEAPAGALGNVKSVAYEYVAPSATPKTRAIEKSSGGFRARFGALACAKEVKIVVTMKDGRKQKAAADGCQALN